MSPYARYESLIALWPGRRADVSLLAAIWQAVRETTARELFGVYGRARVAHEGETRRADSPEELNRQLDEIEARAEARRVRIIEAEAIIPKGPDDGLHHGS